MGLQKSICFQLEFRDSASKIRIAHVTPTNKASRPLNTTRILSHTTRYATALTGTPKAFAHLVGIVVWMRAWESSGVVYG